MEETKLLYFNHYNIPSDKRIVNAFALVLTTYPLLSTQ